MAEIKNAIVPLKGTNYPTWKVQCKMSLMKDGLWRIVDGSESAPEEGTDGYSKFVTRGGTVPWLLLSCPSIRHFCT